LPESEVTPAGGSDERRREENTKQFRIRVDSESLRMKHTIRRLWLSLGIIGGAITVISSAAFGVGMWRAGLAKAEDVEKIQIVAVQHTEQISDVGKHLETIENRLDYLVGRIDKIYPVGESRPPTRPTR
jgi:hypothetical protein